MVNWDTDPDLLAMDPDLQVRIKEVVEDGRQAISPAALLTELHRLQEQAAREAEAQGPTYEDVHGAAQRLLHPARVRAAG